MARALNRLSTVEVRHKSKPGMYSDGAGLYLNVGPTGAKSWVFRFMLHGRAREMGLGPVHTVSLSEARERAKAQRLIRLDGTDPLEARKNEKARKAAEAAAAAAALVTFETAARTYIDTNKEGWRNEKHAAQWSATLQTYVFPEIGKVAVAEIDTGHVTKILRPIWATKAETATRVRGRIETVLDYAKVQGWRTGDNPARWRGHLDKVLPARAKVARVEHHAAMPRREIAPFMAKLEAEKGIAALALRFTILTAARTSEVTGARWGEIDLDNKLWTVPAERMKAGKLHRVPLTDATLEVLRRAAALALTGGGAPDGFVFPGGTNGTGKGGLSNMALLAVLRRLGLGHLTVHGFRSTFRDWAAEATSFPSEVVEMSLAHAVGSKVEAAYRRTDLFEKRRELMQAWATFCGQVTPGVAAEAMQVAA